MTTTTTTFLGVCVNLAEQVVRQNNVLQRSWVSLASKLPREHTELLEQFQASGEKLKRLLEKLLRMQKALAVGPVADTFQAFLEEELREFEKIAKQATEEAELLTTVFELGL
jgi:hypothetical protein